MVVAADELAALERKAEIASQQLGVKRMRVAAARERRDELQTELRVLLAGETGLH